MQFSAMIAAEWTMKKLFFREWAFPYESSALLYESLGRHEEARDTARLTLKQPWWTIDQLPRCAVCDCSAAGPWNVCRA